MSFHKSVKFPFEVSKGKSRDLFKLKFLRKSELEPSVRHSMRHNVIQTGKQLDLWYKEQLFTIGSLNKDQEKMYQSRNRLRKEQRLIKRQEYARRQEDTRRVLYKIRMRMIMMKVVQKFKENVKRNKDERMEVKRANVDFLRLPENKQHIKPTEHDVKAAVKKEHKSKPHRKKKAKTTTFVEQRNNYVNNEPEFTSSTVNKQNKDDRNSETNNPSTDETFGSTENNSNIGIFYAEEGANAKNVTDAEVNAKAIMSDTTDTKNRAPNNDEKDTEDGTEDYSEEDEEISDDEDSQIADKYSVGFRQLSSQGPRMETIPEETIEIEVDIENEGDEKTRLTKRRLQLLNRSYSKRDVFNAKDAKDNIPLLPELPSSHGRHSYMVHRPDTTDAETQTSDTSSKKNAAKANEGSTNANRPKKQTLVVKVPQTGRSNKSNETNSGNFGSDSEDGDNLTRTNTTEFASFGHSDIIVVSESESDDCFYSDEDIEFVSRDAANRLLTNNSYAYQPRTDKTIKVHRLNFPDEIDLSETPSLQTLQTQDPYSLQYKERSFFLKSRQSDRQSVASARTERSVYIATPSKHTKPSYENSTNKWQDTVKDMHARREIVTKSLDSDHNIAVFGKKAKKTSNKSLVTPPNTPIIKLIADKRKKKSHLRIMQSQKLDQSNARQRIHDVVNSEPVQQYERTKSGRLLPFGSPRVVKHEMPSMKEHYHRDKLLKAERSSMFSQNMKLRRFINTFESECSNEKLPPIAHNPAYDTRTQDPAVTTRKSLGNFLFKVHSAEQTMGIEKKIVPGVSTTSIRLLRNCRYLRESYPIGERALINKYVEKETSWKMKNSSSITNNYIANVRLQL